MDRHGLKLERKPEVARVAMDGLAPRLGNLRRLLSPPKAGDAPRKAMHAVSAQFGGAPPALFGSLLAACCSHAGCASCTEDMGRLLPPQG